MYSDIDLRIACILTERHDLADERHGQAEVQVAVEQDRPDIAAPSPGARAHHQQPEPKHLLHLERLGDAERQLKSRESDVFVYRMGASDRQTGR